MYFKILEHFILRVLFHKDEYNITSKNFNPIRFFSIMFLVINAFFTCYLLYKMNGLYERIDSFCPAVFQEEEKEVEEAKIKATS